MSPPYVSPFPTARSMLTDSVKKAQARSSNKVPAFRTFSFKELAILPLSLFTHGNASNVFSRAFEGTQKRNTQETPYDGIHAGPSVAEGASSAAKHPASAWDHQIENDEHDPTFQDSSAHRSEEKRDPVPIPQGPETSRAQTLRKRVKGCFRPSAQFDDASSSSSSAPSAKQVPTAEMTERISARQDIPIPRQTPVVSTQKRRWWLTSRTPREHWPNTWKEYMYADLGCLLTFSHRSKRLAPL